MDKQRQNNQENSGGIVNLYKERGDTPLQTLTKFREKFPEYRNEILSYAGRLDPMAEGVLLVSVGKENNSKEQKEKLLNFEKTYEVDILFGIETDTYDILGKILSYNTLPENIITKEKLLSVLETFKGTYEQEYPPYSSKPVKGKSLFEWAREGMIDTIEIPKATITISDISLQTLYDKEPKKLLKNIEEDIKKVVGDFRQEEILKSWNYVLHTYSHMLKLAKIYITCSSGTYMRKIAHEIGNKMNTGACVYGIKRLKLGIFNSIDSLRL